MIRVELDDNPTGVRVARRAVRGFCRGDPDVVDALVQCVSEVVTNALLHGAPPVVLEAAATAAGVRVSVADGGSGSAVRRDPLGPETLSGRGLGIVDALASRWGTTPAGTGKVVWFEFDQLSAEDA